MTLPTRMRDVRRFIEAIDVRQIEVAVADEARAQIVIVGPVNSGKSTLFNHLKGKKLSSVSAVPGTTKEAYHERFGPFWLVDTPGFGEVAGTATAAAATDALTSGDVAILVLDASAGVRQSDADLLHEIRLRGMPVVVVLNKIDLIQKRKKNLQEIMRDAERKMRMPIIPISAKKGDGISDDLIPALIDAHPRMAVTIGRALPRYRRKAARRIINESGAVASVVGAEPIPGLSIPLLIGIQIRMLLRLAAIYGDILTAARARELISAVAGGIAIRYGAQELAKFVPAAGWLIAGIGAGTGTVALGNAALVFFENANRLSPEELRNLYRRLRWRRRKVQAEILESNDGTQIF